MTLSTGCICHQVDEVVVVLVLEGCIKHNHTNILQFSLDVPVVCLCLQEIQLVKVSGNKDGNKQLISLACLLAVFDTVLKGELVCLLTVNLNLVWTSNVGVCLIELIDSNVRELGYLISKLELAAYQILLDVFNLVSGKCGKLYREYAARQTLNNALLVEVIKNHVNICSNLCSGKEVLYVLFRRRNGIVVCDIVEGIEQEDSFEHTCIVLALMLYLQIECVVFLCNGTKACGIFVECLAHIIPQIIGCDSGIIVECQFVFEECSHIITCKELEYASARTSSFTGIVCGKVGCAWVQREELLDVALGFLWLVRCRRVDIEQFAICIIELLYQLCVCVIVKDIELTRHDLERTYSFHVVSDVVVATNGLVSLLLVQSVEC